LSGYQLLTINSFVDQGTWIQYNVTALGSAGVITNGGQTPIAFQGGPGSVGPTGPAGATGAGASSPIIVVNTQTLVSDSVGATASTANNAVVIGATSCGVADNVISIGFGSKSFCTDDITIGRNNCNFGPRSVVIGNDNCAGGAGVGISQNVTVGYLNCLIGSGGNGGLGTVIGQCNKIKSEGQIPGRTSIGIGSENCNNAGFGQDILIGSQNYMLATDFPAAGQLMLGYFNCVPAGCGYYSNIIGSSNCVNGKFATVVGTENKACNSGNLFDDGSHIFGRCNTITVCCSNIFGFLNCVSGLRSNIIGTSSFVSSACSHVIGHSSCVTAGCGAVLGNSSCSTHSNAVVLGSGLSSKVASHVHVSNMVFTAATGPYASDTCFYAAGGTAGQTYMLCVGGNSYLTVAGYN